MLKTKEAVLRVLESPSEHIGISYSNHSSKVSTNIWKNKTEPATPAFETTTINHGLNHNCNVDATEIISGIRKSLTFFKNESALLDVKMKTLSAYISMLNHLTKKKVEMCMDFLCLLDGMNRIIKANLKRCRVREIHTSVR